MVAHLKLASQEADLEGLINLSSLVVSIGSRPLEARLKKTKAYFEGRVPHILRDEIHYATLLLEYTISKLVVKLGAYTLHEFRIKKGVKEILDAAPAVYVQYKCDGIQVLGVSTQNLALKMENSTAAIETAWGQTAQYNPDLLVSDLWIIYQLGINPRDNKRITETRSRIFQRDDLISRFKTGYGGYYRVGDFKDADFAPFDRTARKVLTNPYLCERNPEEYISEIDVTCELGISRKHAGDLLRNCGIEPTLDIMTNRKKLYRRADVHERLGLPGWLPKNIPQEP